MWGRWGWLSICGLALVVPALVMLPDLGKAVGHGIAGILGWGALFAILYAASLLFTALVALAGAVAIAVVVEEIIPGLRGG
ncbi:MAG: hypothetical protein OXH83_19425 [Bryobacterales bacterium]|nr:hypothetical protein [Bryobacterales bacterium]